MDNGMLQFDPNDPYQLELLRAKMAPDDIMHSILGPQSHKQFTQEVVERSPMMALPMLAATPAYTAGKAMGFFPNARSPASMDEIFAGWEGVGRGMSKGVERMLSDLIPSAYAHHEQSETVQRNDGKWINVYGRGTPKAGQPLPDSGVYDSVDAATSAARSRSESYGNKKHHWFSPRSAQIADPRLRSVDGSFPKQRPGMLTPRPSSYGGGGGVRG